MSIIRRFRFWLIGFAAVILTFVSSPSHWLGMICSLNSDQAMCAELPASLTTAQRSTDPQSACPVVLFDNLGDYHHPITTRSPQAQQYFDQGLTLVYGFNHPEAARAFREAIRLDQTCTMCHWGLALALGPHINAGMSQQGATEAWQALQTARSLSQTAPTEERAYVEALATRYVQNPPADRRPLDRAYADAMRQVAQQYPNDPDAATLFAEALMNTTPWYYWNGSQPKPETVEILKALESALTLNVNHPGANHYYIHAVEASPQPEQAVPHADRLKTLVPGAGHLLHMPSHIQIQLGQYHNAVVANQQAVKADQEYAKTCPVQSQYLTRLYAPHNYHFLWVAAMMGGEGQVALEAAQQIATNADRQLSENSRQGTLQHHAATPLYTWVKFGKWDEILATTAPTNNLPYPRGVWHFARGTAFRATGNLQAGMKELQQLRTIAADPQLKSVKIESNSAATLLQLAAQVLSGELAAAQGNYDAAIQDLQAAIALEDTLKYVEPQAWHSPVRQTLGGVLLQAQRPAEAETIYREDLARYPENGWSLFGLAASLQAQGKTEAAEAVRTRFETAWHHADVQLTASYL
ncbi:tetratricopeptide repeat protein [Pantanalinema rosaneae CENA516]|uniref:tetratricopeptide repeat protein n=1 Tax=Pantanalinema rosaneae TaxID=1620701 RepID=UPI003D6FE6C2